MDEAAKVLLNYGVLGVSVIALAAYIKSLHKERKEAREEEREERGEWKDIAKEGHKAIERNSDVLSGLKTLLETTRERK